MSYEIPPGEVGPRPPFWTRVMAFVASLDEAVSRTEADDLIDRIAALERRVDALEPHTAASDLGTATRLP